MERISTKTIGAQLSAMMGLGVALDAVRASGIKSLDLMSEERGIGQLDDCAAQYLAELVDEALGRMHEVFVDVGGKIVARGEGGNPAFDKRTRQAMTAVLRAADWSDDAITHVFEVLDDSVADGCFLPEPSGAPTVDALPSSPPTKTTTGPTVTPIAHLPDGSTVLEVVGEVTPGELGEIAAAAEGVTFLEPGESPPTDGVVVGGRPPPPVPVHVSLGDCSTIVEALGLAHDMAESTEDIASERDALRAHAKALITKFQAVIARNRNVPPELSDVELKARGLRRLEQGDDVSQIVEVAGHEYMPDEPREATTVELVGPNAPPSAPVPTSLREVAEAVENAARPVAASDALPYEAEPTVLKGPDGIVLTLDVREADVNDPGNGTPALVGLGDYSASYDCAMGTTELTNPAGATLELEHDQLTWLDAQQRHVDELWRQARERDAVKLARAEARARAQVADIAARARKVIADAPSIAKPTGADVLEVLAAKSILADVPPELAPTSSACKRETWCVLQIGHEGPCLPTMMRDGSF